MGHRRYLVLIALLAVAAAQADPKDPPIVPPPMAQPQSLSIFRGRSIDVPLRAQGRAPGQLKFLIRSLPAKGRLSEIRLTGPKSAEITYFHDDTSEETDSFTFAVQAFDSPVSAAAPITITIVRGDSGTHGHKIRRLRNLGVGHDPRRSKSSCTTAVEESSRESRRFRRRGRSRFGRIPSGPRSDEETPCSLRARGGTGLLRQARFFPRCAVPRSNSPRARYPHSTLILLAKSSWRARMRVSCARVVSRYVIALGAIASSRSRFHPRSPHQTRSLFPPAKKQGSRCTPGRAFWVPWKAP